MAVIVFQLQSINVGSRLFIAYCANNNKIFIEIILMYMKTVACNLNRFSKEKGVHGDQNRVPLGLAFRSLKNLRGKGDENFMVKGGYPLENSSVLAHLFTAYGEVTTVLYFSFLFFFSSNFSSSLEF